MEFNANSLIDRDRVIEQHRSYVRALAQNIAQTFAVFVDVDELEAYGQLGLIEAAERYDPRRGVAFTTFSYYRIRGAIYDGLREMGVITRTSPLRERFRANANDVLQTAADDETSVNRPQMHAVESVDDQIVEAQAMIDALIPIYLLSLESDRVPQIKDQQALSNEQIEFNDLAVHVRDLLAELTPEEQNLIRALYFQQQSMTDLAKTTHVTKSWISRRHTRAIQHLRDLMIAHGMLYSEEVRT